MVAINHTPLSRAKNNWPKNLRLESHGLDFEQEAKSRSLIKETVHCYSISSEFEELK